MLTVALAIPILAALLALPNQSRAALGSKRLRTNAVIPHFTPIEIRQDAYRDVDFEQTEDEMEAFFKTGMLRPDASLSFSVSIDSGGSSGSDHGNGDEEVDDGSVVFAKCGTTRQRRSVELLDILSNISDRAFLEDISSSRYQARRWLDLDDSALLCTNNIERVLQRYRAALIYFHLGGDSWGNCRANRGLCFQEDSTSVPAIRFLAEAHECLWFGLSCSNVPRAVVPSQADILSPDVYEPIVSVDISDNSLSGELFHELFGMTALQELTLDGNKAITGSIPDAVGQLTSLIAIDIDDNALVGTLPQSLYSLTKLEAIDLNSNLLTGTISNTIGNLKNLVVVQLDNNGFTGEMPTDGLFQLEALAVWTILDNNLTGSTEQLCEVIDERRVENEFPGYLQFFWVDCLGTTPKVECSCCECTELQSPTSF